MKEFNIEAKVDNLDKVLAFIDGELEAMDCPMKAQMQIDVAVEEVYVNIASYAYEGKEGPSTIAIESIKDGTAVAITFIDEGIPYNPLAKEDPDVTLSAEERQIGGLGIYIVKKSMDATDYKRSDNKNIFRMEKNF